jgi:hypothetical protein
MPRHHTAPGGVPKACNDPAKVAEKQHVRWLYEQDRKVRPRGPDAVAAVDDFNLDPVNVGNENVAEIMYGKLEEAALPVLEKLRAGDPRLSEEEKGTLSYFIRFQKFRTTLNREILTRRPSTSSATHAAECSTKTVCTKSSGVPRRRSRTR